MGHFFDSLYLCFTQLFDQWNLWFGFLPISASKEREVFVSSLLTIDIKMKCCNKLTSCLSVCLIWMLIRTFFANATPRRSLTYWETNVFKKIWNLNVVHIRLFSFHDIYFFFGLRSLEYLVHKKITFKFISCLHYHFLLTNIFAFPPSPKWLIKPKTIQFVWSKY
jgi:hypothetical protein